MILELEAKDYRLVLGDSFCNHVTQKQSDADFQGLHAQITACSSV